MGRFDWPRCVGRGESVERGLKEGVIVTPLRDGAMVPVLVRAEGRGDAPLGGKDAVGAPLTEVDDTPNTLNLPVHAVLP